MPSKTICPPRSPGPGPISTIRSAANITAGSCSTTTKVLPASRRRNMAWVMRCISRGCKPMLGSSNTNKVFTNEVPKAVVKLMRCTSPPLKVRLCLSKLKYPKPTSQRYFKRVRISSNNKCSACCSACAWAVRESSCAMCSKNTLKRSMGNSIKSCKHNPGKALNCSRVHATPCGIKRFASGMAALALTMLPTRHNKLSVCKRAPPHSPQGV